MPSRNLGSRLKRFFFEVPEKELLLTEETARPAEEPAKRLASVEELAPGAPTFSETILMEPGQPFDVRAIYAAAGIPSEGRFTAEKALEMVRGFPADLPLEVKRATARTALSAVGKSDREILQDAAEKIRALETYVEAGQRELDELTQEAEGRIAELEKQIAEWRQVVEAKRKQQEELAQRCNQAADELEEVVDFFTPDVSPPPTNRPDASAASL